MQGIYEKLEAERKRCMDGSEELARVRLELAEQQALVDKLKRGEAQKDKVGDHAWKNDLTQ